MYTRIDINMHTFSALLCNICACIRIHVCKYIYIRVYVCNYIYIRMYICMYIVVENIYTHMLIDHVCKHVHMYMYMYICI